ERRAPVKLGPDDELLVRDAQAGRRAEDDRRAARLTGDGRIARANEDPAAGRVREEPDVPREGEARNDARAAITDVLIRGAGGEEDLSAKGRRDRLAVLAEEAEIEREAHVTDGRLARRGEAIGAKRCVLAVLINRDRDI